MKTKILLSSLFVFVLPMIYAATVESAPVVSMSVVAKSDVEQLHSDEQVAHPVSSVSNLGYAKKVNNPLSTIIMLPVGGQYLTYTEGPAAGSSVFEAYIRPTFPIVLNEDFKLINHAVLPYMNIPTFKLSSDDSIVGVANGRQSFFEPIQLSSVLSTNHAKGWNYGVGPNVNIPAGNSYLGSTEYYALGAAGIISYVGNHIVFYASAQNAWNLGNNNQFFLLNPSVSYNFNDGWFLNSSPFITANPAVANGDLTIPLGIGGGKVLRIGKMPISLSLQGYYNVVRANYYPNMEVKGSITFILPE